MPVVVFSRGMCNTKDPSALVNVCICVRFTRPSLGVQTPARGSFVLSSLGWFVEVFICSAADVLFGRAASVETCECRARLTGGRDGCRRFARRPPTPQYERPVKSPAGFVARRPMGRGAARPSTRFVFVCSRGRARLLQRPVPTVASAWSAKIAVGVCCFS